MSAIHVIGEDGAFEVWLDTEENQEMTGCVIGLGTTRETALKDAVADLETALDDLKALR